MNIKTEPEESRIAVIKEGAHADLKQGDIKLELGTSQWEASVLIWKLGNFPSRCRRRRLVKVDELAMGSGL